MKDIFSLAMSYAPILVRVLLTLIGLALVAMAALEQFEIGAFKAHAPDALSRLFLAALGAPLLLLGAFLSVRYKSGHGDPEAVDVKVSVPNPNIAEECTSPLEVRGTLKSVSAGAEVWIFAVSGSGLAAKYWPYAAVNIQGNDWTCHIPKVSGKYKERKRFAVFVVGAAGQALVAYYKYAGNENSRDGTGRWPAITKLSPDIILCTAFEIIVKDA